MFTAIVNDVFLFCFMNFRDKILHNKLSPIPKTTFCWLIKK